MRKLMSPPLRCSIGHEPKPSASHSASFTFCLARCAAASSASSSSSSSGLKPKSTAMNELVSSGCELAQW